MKHTLLFLWIVPVVAALLGGCGQAASSGPNATSHPVDGDDQYTVLLKAFTGDSHVQQAQYYKQNTETLAGWQGLFIVTKDNYSELFWGKYSSVKAAQGSLNTARNWRTKFGVKPYELSHVVMLPGKEIGPPEWNLAATQGKYTVLIATFFDVPEANYIGRRNFAVEYCTQLRQQGEEAYYFHGARNSLVTVGVFNEDALEDMPGNGGTIVKRHVKDPRIAAILNRHPLLAQNGRKVEVLAADIRTGKARQTDKASGLIEIPRKEANEIPLFDRAGNPQPR